MPGPCQRLRLPSLATVIRTSRVDYTTSNLIRKEHRRVVVMGSARVGKTCIISQFLYDKYIIRYRQTVEELHRGDYNLPDGSSLTLDILDTSGAFEFPAMRTLSISTAGAFILVFAVDDLLSWDEVERLRKEIIEARGYKVPIVVVGNKTDIEDSERKLQSETIAAIVREDWKSGYIECSAKDNTGIVEVFKELLVQANIRYNLSPAVRRRRQSLPSYSSHTNKSVSNKFSFKRHSCTVT
ncbi:ras-related protein Rap-2a-like [Episyrphus balteatus]|uniref:ras-related protein Rap-2a-like n=1 Tax=Episyrphus balteatus TaxID=286459 RepID=UPI0024854E1C|nr:ras-related protein Rap-2a-like [Episyrphus balteatus]XP_055837446.1 ras-related protein Rap-2a-like [Episyrphus balteatus]XP_055837447.1 ras-related protein Rap-2a-like [Episyrphus balteatus]XP_055837448.1 ras-related protein Rap-2a-like [Episyrphus balteatus]